MEQNFLKQILNKNLNKPFGKDILREVLLPSIVGDNNDIYYWAGKLLARKLLLASNKDLKLFFKYAEWGNLKLIKSKKHIDIFELTGDNIKLRLHLNRNADFNLELGFISETYQINSNYLTEGKIKEIDNKKNIVYLSIKTDIHDPINNTKNKENVEPFSMIEYHKLNNNLKHN